MSLRLDEAITQLSRARIDLARAERKLEANPCGRSTQEEHRHAVQLFNQARVDRELAGDSRPAR